MRLWSLHPQYLDAKGLVAAWREGLLAQKCLAGQTKGYNNHPQLNRFKEMKNPISAIGTYLNHIALEAEMRTYCFDASKILVCDEPLKMTVTQGQIRYEWKHFLMKIQTRDPKRYLQLESVGMPESHPIFRVIDGKIASWEKLQ